MIKTAPSIDRFVFAGGRVVECENWREVEEVPVEVSASDSRKLKALETARDLLAPACESPLEIAFGVQLYWVLLLSTSFTTTICRNEDAPNRPPDEILIVPQFRYSRYRTDIAVRFPWLARRWVFVECDGKAFHSSGRQIQMDRGRQQEMMDAGFRVFRFGGAQLRRWPFSCANMVANYGLSRRPRETSP